MRNVVGARWVLCASIVTIVSWAVLSGPSHHLSVWAQEQDAAPANTLSFTDVTAAIGMANAVTGSHGAFWADATGDGRPDLFLSYNECRSGIRANKFYRNLGGTFAEEALARGLQRFTGGTHGGSWADLDNDGDYDLVEGNTYVTDCVMDEAPPALANRILRNDGGVFVNVTPPSMAGYPPPGSVGEGYTRSILSFDMDRDGDLDIFGVNGDQGSRDIGDRNELYRNNGGFNFSAVTSGPLITAPAGQAGADLDYDGDGDIDIIMPDFGGFVIGGGNVRILRNDGGGIFTEIPRSAIGIAHSATTGISSGDLNNDGRTDLILVDQDRDPNRRLGFDRIAYIYLSTGAGTFGFAAEIRGFSGYTAGVADLDNDGDLDLTFPGLPFVLLNDGAAHFSQGPFYPSPLPAPGCVGAECFRPDPRTVAFADIDDDGDLDSVVTTKFGPFYTIRNNFNGGNWLKVQLTAANGQAGAFGAKVRVFRAGTSSLIAMREARNVYGYLSQDDPVIHVGLGSVGKVDVEVTYLDGLRVTRRDVQSNQTIAFFGATVLEPTSPPRNLTFTVNGPFVTLNWDAPTSGTPTSYEVRAGSAPGLSDLATLPTGLARTLTATAPNGTYFVRAHARNVFGLSPASNEVTIVVGPGGPCSVPNAPGTLSFTRAGSIVTLNWGAPSGGTPPIAYLVEVGSQSGASNLVIFDTGAPVLSLTASAPPGRYFVRIRGKSACGSGPASNEVVIDVP